MRTTRPFGRSHGHLRKLALVTFATAAAAGLSSTAHAEVLSTSITSPTENQILDADLGHLDFSFEIPDEGPEVPEIPGLSEFPTTRVTGTATTDGTPGDEVAVFVAIPLKRLNTLLPLGPPTTAPVAADGSFSADVPTPPINARIVAVPTSLESSDAIEQALLDLTGPFKATTVLGGIGASVSIPEFGNLALSLRGQRQGFGLISTPGLAGLNIGEFGEGLVLTPGLLGGVTSGTFGATEGDFALNFMGAAGISNHYNGARGGLMVDGARAYLRDHIPVGTDVLPAPTTQRTVDFQTGGQTLVHTQPVYAAANPADNPHAPVLEGGYRPLGLELQRTTVQDHDGRQVSVTDRFRSTDGAAHRVDVLYAEGLSILAYDGRSPMGMGEVCGFLPCPTVENDGPLAGLRTLDLDRLAPLDDESDEPGAPAFPTIDMPAFRIPWETGAAWETRSHADPMTAPGTATSTVYTRLPNVSSLLGAFFNFGEEGAPAAIESTYGAITYGTRPDSGLFVADPISPVTMILGGVSTQYVSRFVREVPAGGNTTIAQVYSTGTTQPEVEALAAAAEKRLAPAAPAPLPTPVAPPGPPTPAPARKAPRKLSAASKLQRTKKGQYRFRFSGRLTLPSGVAKSACRAGGGTVTIQIKAGANTISTRRVKLDRNCKYAVRVNFRSRARFGNRTRLTVIAKWSGNRALGPKPAKKFTVKVR